MPAFPKQAFILNAVASAKVPHDLVFAANDHVRCAIDGTNWPPNAELILRNEVSYDGVNWQVVGIFIVTKASLIDNWCEVGTEILPGMRYRCDVELSIGNNVAINSEIRTI